MQRIVYFGKFYVWKLSFVSNTLLIWGNEIWCNGTWSVFKFCDKQWRIQDFTVEVAPTYYYRPQRSCDKVMFLHLSVILFTGERVSSRHPPGSRHRREQTVDTPCPRVDPPPEQTSPPPRETATAADGTHPTGMHSFWNFFSWKVHET